MMAASSFPNTRMSDATPVRNVSDTARWVAIYRAMESERPDALFRDPYARRLGGERGEAIVRAMPRGRSMAWPMIVRTAVMGMVRTGRPVMGSISVRLLLSVLLT